MIDEQYGEAYAIKNPELVAKIARLLFDDYAILRAHHARKK